MAGLTALGFQAKTLEEIKAELEADLRSRISPNIDLGTESPTGQLVGIMAGQLRKLWELAEAVYNSQYPDSASGFSLRALSVLTGTQAEGATPSRVLVTVNVDPGTYAVGDLVAHVNGVPEARFRNAVEVTNGGGAAANVTGVLFESEDTGPVRANAGTLTVIAEAVAGWNSVTNPADAELGSEEETDAALRTRREEELATPGSTTVDGIRADVLDVEDVISCTVLENDTDGTVDGMPPHSVEAIVRGGTDQAVADAVFRAKAGGAKAHGSTVMTVVDSQGVSHSVGITRPTVVDIWIAMVINVRVADWVGATETKETLVDWGDANLLEGVDVVREKLKAITMGVAGVEDIVAFTVDIIDPPVGTANISINPRQIADLDTARIAITAVAV